MSLGLRHLHARKRAAKGLSPYPERGFRRFYDRLMLVVSIIMPAALLPQVIDIYATRSAVGISLTTFSLLALFNVMWALYGLMHREQPIIFSNILLVLLNLSIVVGILRFS